jgi:hypothetical protein
MSLPGCNRLMIHRCPHSITSAVESPQEKYAIVNKAITLKL